MSQPNRIGQDLQLEAERARYALRSSFFYRIHDTWNRLLNLANEGASEVISWQERLQWGISGDAWDQVEGLGVTPVLVFCHPDIIRREPRLIAYYRCLALLPQKGMQRLATGTQGLEEGRGNLSDDRAIRITGVLNSLISLLIDSDPDWTLEGARTAALLNFGTQVNGSWRNEIGTEGSRKVKELVVVYALENGFIDQINLLDGSQIVPTQFAQEIESVRSLRLTNEYSLSFSSEPDIAIRDQSGNLLATVEIKYGLDPAAALERYGAAKKSFEEATRENVRVTNVYLASCITSEVRRRITEDRLVNQEFNLTEVLDNPGTRQQLLAYIRRLVNL